MIDNRRAVPDQIQRQKSLNPGRTEPGQISALPSVTVPGMAYVPFQTDSETYEPCRALSAGTIFPCLDKPFAGGKCI